MAYQLHSATGSGPTVTNGIHFAGSGSYGTVTFTGNAFDSNGFSVDGSGNLIALKGTAGGFNATTLGTVTAVNYGGNSAKTGWYFPTQDATAGLSINGVLKADYGITTSTRFSFSSTVASTVASSWVLVAGTASGTVPTLVPRSDSTNSGVGGNAAGNTSIISAATEIFRFTSTGPLAIVLPTDAATTDNTMCVNTTTHVMSSGSGTLGICLGTSSARFKTGIAALTPGLAEILKLKPVSFYLDKAHGDPKKQMYGFIAEDMVKVLPKLVGLDKQGRPNTADYLGVVPVLVSAMQQQQSQIVSLTTENVGLRASNDNFSRRLSALEGKHKIASR